ncbi:MAG: endo-1,4-beta-xylanase [Planctomycetota bacterium]
MTPNGNQQTRVCLSRRGRGPRRSAAAAVLLAALACAPSLHGQTLRQAAEPKGLFVGAMFLNEFWTTPQHRATVVREFNCLTLNLAPHRTRPARGRFAWGVTEDSARWAERHNMALIGHALVFPHDKHTPQWILDTPASQAEAVLREHIAGSMAQYRGRVKAWVVANEAVSPAGGYRDSYWLRSLGPSYVSLAHRLARDADPTATLVYNDHDIELSSSYQTRKWETAQKILRRLVADGTVDALGWQLHTTTDEVLGDEFVLEERMRWVRDELGLANFVTELDIVVGPNEPLDRQAEAYRRVAEVWRRYAGGGWLQTWGVHDGSTHLGSGARPLLFNERYRPKPAYFAVRQVLAADP